MGGVWPMAYKTKSILMTAERLKKTENLFSKF
jgi:hypothetical protein